MNGMVETIRLGWLDTTEDNASSFWSGIQLGELNMLLGSPKSVMPQQKCSSYTILNYTPTLRAAIDSNAPVHIDTKILYIQLTNHRPRRANDLNAEIWQGFASAARYGVTRCEGSV